MAQTSKGQSSPGFSGGGPSGGRIWQGGPGGGKPEASELIRRVTATDPDEVMPPKGPRLTPAEVASLTRWIREGALWPDSNTQKHWSFQAPIRPNPPENLPKTATLQNPIDRFIVARLAKEGLQQQPEADRANLIRRVSSTSLVCLRNRPRSALFSPTSRPARLRIS